MARISTYQHDAMPHAEDNVIGTNQSPGHANETVLFSLAGIQELFREGTVFTEDIDVGEDLDNLPSPIPADFDYSTVPSFGENPIFTLNHNFGTDNLDYRIFILTSDGFYRPIERLPAEYSDIQNNTEVFQTDMNNLVVIFPSLRARIRARIIILG